MDLRSTQNHCLYPKMLSLWAIMVVAFEVQVVLKGKLSPLRCSLDKANYSWLSPLAHFSGASPYESASDEAFRAGCPSACTKRSGEVFVPTREMGPVEHANLRSLSSDGYSNVLPSLRISPVLLSGQLARKFLSRILTSGTRVLKYSFQIPVMQPGSLPANFPSDF